MATLPKPAGGNVDIGYRLEIGGVVTFVLAAVVVAARVVSRTVYARLSIDDYSMLIAIVCALLATVMSSRATHWGLGRHAYYLTPKERANQQYYSYIAQAFCLFAITFAKISICLSYIRIIQGSKKATMVIIRYICWIIMVTVFIANLLTIIMFWASCLPAQKSWNRAIPGYCMPAIVPISFDLMQGSYSSLTDFVLCILPVFLLKDVRISLKNKTVLCGLMGLGLITGIFAAVRTVETSAGVHGPIYDVSFVSINGLMWASMERNLVILLGSVPSLRPLGTPLISFVSHTFSKLTSRSATSANSGHRGDDSYLYEMSRRGAAVGVNVMGKSSASSVKKKLKMSSRDADTASNSTTISKEGHGDDGMVPVHTSHVIF